MRTSRSAPFALGVACALAALPIHEAAAFFHGGDWGGRSFGGGSRSFTGPRGSTAFGGGGSWSASGFRGGHASGGGGAWSGTGYRGGTASGGSGAWHATGAFGGTASGGRGYWNATGRYGNTAYGGYNRYGGRYYYGYHPPTVVNHYYGSGCYNCGGWNAGGAWAAGLTGAAVGAAVANAAARRYAMNDIYPVLPAGCGQSLVGGLAYYNCGGTWFSPYYGANGTYYRVVPVP